MTSKSQADGLGLIVSEGRVRRQEVLYFVLAMLKCTKINLSKANNAPCLLTHP
jgi:hypothetical protein